MELIFWISVLIGWAALVIYGLAFLDKKIDKVLDLWFHPESGYIEPRRPCYPCYLIVDKEVLK